MLADCRNDLHVETITVFTQQAFKGQDCSNFFVYFETGVLIVTFHMDQYLSLWKLNKYC